MLKSASWWGVSIGKTECECVFAKHLVWAGVACVAVGGLLRPAEVGASTNATLGQRCSGCRGRSHKLNRTESQQKLKQEEIAKFLQTLKKAKGGDAVAKIF